MDRLGGTTLDCAGHVAAEFVAANGKPAWIGGRCDRHGETVTLQRMAESFSGIGVPVFAADAWVGVDDNRCGRRRVLRG